MAVTHTHIETPLGLMTAIAEEDALLYLGFEEITVRKKTTAGDPWVIRVLQRELEQYFEGALQEFHTPCRPQGTPFQKTVWEELKKIPRGKTCSYAELAMAVGRPSAYRAVAQANGRNPLCILVPCHRVIYADGSLGGYSSGLERKKWLLHHESNYFKTIALRK